MGVSVASNVANGGRRGYSRPYRLARPSQEKAAMGDSDSSSEELRYGPGIVSRLKDRYISMALREATRRPSLRRVSSLEHIVNAPEEAKPASGGGGGGAALPGRGRGRLDSMKRAKSVGDLASARPSGPAPAADGSRPQQHRDRKEPPPPADALPEKIVIVEETARRPVAHPVLVPPQGRPAPMAESPPAGEDALPAPDTVKTVKRLFEPSPRRAGVSRPVATGTRAVIDRTGKTRRTSPSSRPAPPTARPTVKPASPALKTSSREKLTSGAVRGPPLKAVPVSAAGSAGSSGPGSPSGGESDVSRRTASEDTPDLTSRRPEKLTWSQLRQSSVSEGTQTPSPPSTPPVTSPVTQPTSPTRQAVAPLKKSLSRESSAEPASPTSSPVRRQVGIIKPNRKVEHRTDEFNRRKNTLNHVRNSVVEKEIAVIGTEYLKRRDHLEEPTPLTKPAPVLNGARETQDSAPPPALPPRKAVFESNKTLPLSIDTAPPRPAPFQGVILKPVPKTEPVRPEEPSPSPPLKPKTRQLEPVREPEQKPVPAAVTRPQPEAVTRPQSAAVTRPQPAAVTRPQPAAVTRPQPEAVTRPQPAAVTRPQPAAVTRPQPEAVTRPQPAAVTRPQPAAVTRPQPEAVTRPQPAAVTRPQPAAPAPEVVNRGPAAAKPKWHQAADNSMTFNFTKRQEVPDYVEDDGLILRRKLPKATDSGYVILPGFDPGQTCDDDLALTLECGPPSPCNVVFTNADIIVDGKSSLMKKPKTRKMAVSFSVISPSKHEYPSETSLLASETATAVDGSATTGGLGGLASYTPHKQSTGADFELGVSRLTPTAPAARPSDQPSSAETDQFLKPADESETVTWSSETSADILF